MVNSLLVLSLIFYSFPIVDLDPRAMNTWLEGRYPSQYNPLELRLEFETNECSVCDNDEEPQSESEIDE